MRLKRFFKAWEIKPDFNSDGQKDSKQSEPYLGSQVTIQICKATRYLAMSEVTLFLM